jgi:hypothetical protein
MKLVNLKKSLVLFFAATFLAGCGTNIDFSTFDEVKNTSISIKNFSENLSSVFPVINQNNGGLSKIIQRKNKDFVLVYGSEKYGDKHIYITTSGDAKNWIYPQKITNSSLSDVSPAIIEDKNGLLRLFYSSNQNGDWEIFQITSNDAKKWSAPVKVNLDYQGVSNPNVVVHNGEILLTYEAVGNGIFTAYSKDGKEWLSTQIAVEGKNPSIQVLNNNYISVYETQKNIFIKESRDLLSWSEAKKITGFNEAKYPSLSILDNKILLTFTAKDLSGKWNIFTQKSEKLDIWTEAKKLTDNNFNNTKPSIFSNNKFSILSWTVENNQEITNNKAIYVGLGI